MACLVKCEPLILTGSPRVLPKNTPFADTKDENSPTDYIAPLILNRELGDLCLNTRGGGGGDLLAVFCC